MNKYIKINNDNFIIDVFFEYQKEKFDGSEIFIEDTKIKKHKINSKSISDEFGNKIFRYIDNKIIEISETEISLDKVKQWKKEQINVKLKNKHILDLIEADLKKYEKDVDDCTTKEEILNIEVE